MGYIYTNSEGQTFYLNQKEVHPPSFKKPFTVYFFSLENRPEMACDLPDDKEPVENPHNGLPFVRAKTVAPESSGMKLSEELKWRGLVKDTTVEDLSVFDSDKKWTFYCGFDASAPSQTIGNLAALLAVKTFLRHGHKAILVAGGATTLIGDPGGKTDERELQTAETIAANVEVLKKQIDTVLAGYDYELVNNLDWLGQIKMLDWLRDIGKRFSMSQLVKRDYIAQRLGSEGSGISYTEFSYSLLQAYDFWHLFKTYGCRLQIGGADQWGNCVAGVELIQKLEQEKTEVITLPLVINQATGQKFGKSESGAVWLDPDMTNPYDFYQFWLNCDDQGLEQYLKSFTDFSKDQIDELLEMQAKDPAGRTGQKALAESVTKLVHGPTKTICAQDLTDLAFNAEEADFSEYNFIDRLPHYQLAKSWQINGPDDLLTVLVDRLQLANSRGAAKQMVADGSIRIVGQGGQSQTIDPQNLSGPAADLFKNTSVKPHKDLNSRFWLVARGKNSLGLAFSWVDKSGQWTKDKPPKETEEDDED